MMKWSTNNSNSLGQHKLIAAMCVQINAWHEASLCRVSMDLRDVVLSKSWSIKTIIYLPNRRSSNHSSLETRIKVLRFPLCTCPLCHVVEGQLDVLPKARPWIICRPKWHKFLCHFEYLRRPIKVEMSWQNLWKMWKIIQNQFQKYGDKNVRYMNGT